MRLPDGKFAFLKFIVEGYKFEYTPYVLTEKHAYFPLEEDETTRHVHFAQNAYHYASVSALLQEVNAFLAKCLDLDERHRFLLACFVLSTWVVDRLPVAPYIALVGLPRSGKSTTLHALYLLCRHGLMTSDISSAALYRACEHMTPTLCIDETATAGEHRTLFHLLRSGTSRNSIVFREKHSYRSYGAKVVVWTEMPDDDALNSRCIVIPMQETSRRNLLRPTDPKLLEAAEILQGRLVKFRFDKYQTLRLPQVPGAERLRSRDRDLYEALALPIGEDATSCARLLECLEDQPSLDREPLPPDQIAVAESLFRQIHLQPDQGSYALHSFKSEVNPALAAGGERFRLNERDISSVLRTLGFFRRKRTNSGYVVLIDRAARKHIHELLRTYGLQSLSACLPDSVDQPCEFCEVETPDDGSLTQTEDATPVYAGSLAASGSNRGLLNELRQRQTGHDDDIGLHAAYSGLTDGDLDETAAFKQPAEIQDFEGKTVPYGTISTDSTSKARVVSEHSAHRERKNGRQAGADQDPTERPVGIQPGTEKVAEYAAQSADSCPKSSEQSEHDRRRSSAPTGGNGSKFFESPGDRETWERMREFDRQDQDIDETSDGRPPEGNNGAKDK